MPGAPYVPYTVDAATPAPDRLPVVGMVGGGQLARMTHQAAIALGQSLRVLAASPGDPAALVCADVHLGSPDDLDALRGLARDAEAVTFDHEGVPGELLRTLVAEGVAVHPGPDALLHAQDKLVMRRALAGIAGMPAYVEVADTADVEGLAARTGWPVVLKAVRGGYDGRGVWLLDGPDPALVAQLLGVGHAADGRAGGADAPRAGRAGGALARSGRPRRGRSSRRCSATGSASRSSRPRPAWTRRPPRRPRSWPCGSPRALGVTGLLAVELFETDGTAAGLWSTSWRCGRTTRGTGRSRAPARRSSSSTCGRCSTTRWARRSRPRPSS